MINGPAGYDPIQGGMRTEIKAGPGIDISHGIISTTGEAGVPYVGGTGIYIHGATVEADLDPGYRMEINGSTIGQMRYMPVETVSGSSVTLQAGHAYKIYATSAAITLNTETIPANSFGLEGHLEIFVAGTGYVVTGANVVLANALEPDAVNNCMVRFHDGLAIISVEDHVAGYIVTVNAASGAGSLAYGLATATNEYISVDASLNGQTLDLGGAVTNGEKHVVGNGYTETIVSGGINCTSKTTLSNLAADGVIVSSGTLTLGDVYIPNGSTVAVSGGKLDIERVTGDGGIINLGGTCINVGSGTTASISGCTVTSGGLSEGVNQAVYVDRGSLSLKNCVFSGNNSSSYGDILFGGNQSRKADIVIEDCVFSERIAPGDYCNCYLYGSNSFYRIFGGGEDACNVIVGSGAVVEFSHAEVNNPKLFWVFSGHITVSSGATIDMTSNGGEAGGNVVSAASIAVPDGCTVITSAGASVSIAGGTYTKINNDGTAE